jgi:Beta-propeller repeat
MKTKTLAWIGAMTLIAALGVTIQTFAQNTQPSDASQIDTKAQTKIVDQYGKLPLSFEANHGQTDSKVEFLSRGHGYSLFLTSNEAVLTLKKAAPQSRRPKGLPGREVVGSQKEASAASTVLRMLLAGANETRRVVGAEELPGKANYFIGNNPLKWHINVPTFAKVMYESVYPGVDLVYYGNQGQLEYDFVVSPGADPNRIQLKFRDAGRLRVDKKGDLLFGPSGEVLRLQRPHVYQETDGLRKPIEGHYWITAANTIRFSVAEYDRSKPLVIDPVLVYSTYLGGSTSDYGLGIAVDATGNAYVTGETVSPNFPTAKALQPTFGGDSDAFVSKINASGSALVYSTYLGGSGGDFGKGIAVDATGNAYLTGATSSTDFPTANALQPNLGGGGAINAFVTKINASGSALVYSTYLGGSFSDSGSAIALDAFGNVYVTGSTGSSNFPTVNPLQSAPGRIGAFNAFVSKINAPGSALVYSTYLGGSVEDVGNAIAVDTSENVYLTGDTSSTDFPTANALQPTLAAQKNAFVTKINAGGTALVYSTYLGGTVFDFGLGIAVDATGNAYVTGETVSPNFPTAKALQPTFGGVADAFITKINAAGSALVYSTYLGGASADGGTGIAVDSSGNAYVLGETSSTNFPTANAPQPTFGGISDAFVCKINAAGSALVYSTYLGGSDDESSSRIAVDAVGNVYVTGFTVSTNFPTANALQATLTGSPSAFVTKIAPNARSIKESVLNQLEGLLYGSAKHRGEKELKEAIRYLSTSLASELWAPDGNHINSWRGREVFDEEEKAVRELTELLHDKQTTISPQGLQGYISDLVEADRILARIAITDAAGGDQKDIARAKKRLAEGDEDVTSGLSREAIRDYEEAWWTISR